MSGTIEIVNMGQADEILGDGLALLRTGRRLSPRTKPHAHGFHQVTLFLTSPGLFEWRFGEGLVEVERPCPGDVAVSPAFVATSVRWERPFEAVSIRLATDRLARIAERAGFEPGISLRPAGMRRDPFLREIAQKLGGAPQGPTLGRELLADALGTALALHLLREYQAPAVSATQGPAGLAAAALARVRAHVEGNLADNLSVERLASLAGLGPFDFIRRFRASTGTTPHQYVLKRRVEAAWASILAGGEIVDAAVAAGFASQSHLHGHCRRLLGVTPGDLAREARTLNGPPPP